MLRSQALLQEHVSTWEAIIGPLMARREDGSTLGWTTEGRRLPSSDFSASPVGPQKEQQGLTIRALPAQGGLWMATIWTHWSL